MKLAVNILIFAINAALSEALVLAEASGIPLKQAYEVIAQGAVGSPFIGYKRASFLDPAATPVGFALELAEKDLRLILEAAARLGLDLPQTRAGRQLVMEAAAGGRAANDLSTVLAELRSRRRVTVPADSQREGTLG